MISLWAWTLVVFCWSLFLAILCAKLDLMWAMMAFFIVCVTCVLMMGILGTVEYLMYVQAWPFIPQ